MAIYVVLLRGVNVGGRHVLPMKELVQLLEHLGAKNVRTYIQSGNVVLQSRRSNVSGFSRRIAAEIGKRRGFEPQVLFLEFEEFERAMARNPFPEGESEPKSLHLGFLAGVPPNPDLDSMKGIQRESERFALLGKVFYLHAPEGVGKSKLAAKSEKLLGVPMTDRNWRTVCKIRDMARELV